MKNFIFIFIFSVLAGSVIADTVEGEATTGMTNMATCKESVHIVPADC